EGQGAGAMNRADGSRGADVGGDGVPGPDLDPGPRAGDLAALPSSRRRPRAALGGMDEGRRRRAAAGFNSEDAGEKAQSRGDGFHGGVDPFGVESAIRRYPGPRRLTT